MNSTELTPRDLGCFQQVADVIGEHAAEYELQRVIDCDLVGEDWREGRVIATFAWSSTPQGNDFWCSIDMGEYPENYHPPKSPEETPSKYWDGETWPIPAGLTCVIKNCTLGTPCEAVVDYMDGAHCIWHWTDNNGATMHNLVKYMEFSPVKSAREEMIERIEAYFPEKAGALSYEEVAEFVLDSF